MRLNKSEQKILSRMIYGGCKVSVLYPDAHCIISDDNTRKKLSTPLVGGLVVKGLLELGPYERVNDVTCKRSASLTELARLVLMDVNFEEQWVAAPGDKA